MIDSRLADEGDAVRRRRECLACRERFTTFEHAELRLPQIIKSDGRREPFAEAKLRAGLQRALQKRPVDAAQVDAVVAYVRRSLMGSGEREIASRQIGEWLMEQLRALDKVAYVRFASVYHAFQDLNAFREEMERLEDQAVTGLSSKS